MQIIDKLNAVYGNSAPLCSAMTFQAAEFKRRHISLDDDEIWDIKKLQPQNIKLFKFTK